MKKASVIIALLLLMSVGAYSQSTAKKSTASSKPKTSSSKTSSSSKTLSSNKKDIKHWNLGVVGGLGFNTFERGEDYDKHLALAVKAGVYAMVPIVLPDLYLLGGGRLALRTCGNAYTGQISNVYLEVPIHVGYTFRLSNDIAFFAEAGPHIGLTLIKAKHEYDHSGHYNPFDIGLGLNIGAEFNNKNRISLGFDHGFIAPCSYDHAKNGSFWITFTHFLR